MKNRRISITYPQNLPIVSKKKKIIQAVKENQVVIISGETGSGKTTQIPKICLEAGFGFKGIIGCTQPRRIAAVTVSQRVAFELGKIGELLVGYKIRFKDRTCHETVIKFMTDGILLAETQTDRMLTNYEVIIIDEAHERSLNIDFLLGILRRLISRRKRLKLIITSATIDTDKFSKYFNNAPIIEVSGRTYPVEVMYRPIDQKLKDAGEITYIDQAVTVIDELKQQGRVGDILIFLPCERDIREIIQKLQGRDYINTILLPLFGRLSSNDQNRVFRKTNDQKIIASTNIAETSITIPGIKYVIDTGLARISQYNPRMRIQTLPIKNISRSSADQRKGRCGRVKSGICIRLYNEMDYESWPLYTPPEILRSNLAEVILIMLYLKLGNISDFLFVDQPSAGTIKDGYGVLRELGAIDLNRRLTKIGSLMARLPLDPRISRMLIEAKTEHALSEVAIIAAALSIQDPRERPAEEQTQADLMQKRFIEAKSDFLTLLKIWDTYHDTFDRLKTQNQMRKFCITHFLSYRRIRDWRDIYEQIMDILKEEGGYTLNKKPAKYEQIHRSILSGFLSNIAQRDIKKPKEKNIYIATKGKEVMIFPGSVQFGNAGEWIVASQMVQTSKLFARTVATIDVQWIENLAGDLCKVSYHNPKWDMNRGEAVANEQKSLYGLIIVAKRRVSYSRINPDKSKEIFIRSALIEGQVKEKFSFLEHNQSLIDYAKKIEDKVRRRDILADDDVLYKFYFDKIQDVNNINGLKALINKMGGDQFLNMQLSEILIMMPEAEVLSKFPDALTIDDITLSLSYKFSPGNEFDGVCATIPVYAIAHLSKDIFEWLVPGLLLDKITTLLKGLPKIYRKGLIPISNTASEIYSILNDMQPKRSLYAEMEKILSDKWGVKVPRNMWPYDNLMPYHIMKYKVIDANGKVLGEGSDYYKLSKLKAKDKDIEFKYAQKKWSREGIVGWDFENIPDKILISQDKNRTKRFAYPGIYAEKRYGNKDASVEIRLFHTKNEAEVATESGLAQLYMIQFANQLKQLKKDWAFHDSFRKYCKSFGDMGEFNNLIFKFICDEIFSVNMAKIPKRDEFLKKIERIGYDLIPRGKEIVIFIQDLLKQRYDTINSVSRFANLTKNNTSLYNLEISLIHEIENIFPEDFFQIYKYSRIIQMPRYLKAIEIRAQRAYADLNKDIKKANQLIIHKENLLAANENKTNSKQKIKLIEEYRWMIEEFKVSLFAQEIKTAYPVSNKRLMEKWKQIEECYP